MNSWIRTFLSTTLLFVGVSGVSYAVFIGGVTEVALVLFAWLIVVGGFIARWEWRGHPSLPYGSTMSQVVVQHERYPRVRGLTDDSGPR